MRMRRAGRLLAVAAGVTYAAGAAAQPRAPGDGAPPPLRPAWRVNLADTDFFQRYQPWEPTGPAVGPEGLTVIVGAADGLLRRVAVRDGRELWSRDLGGAVRGTLAVDGQHVFMASDDGFVVSLDATGGRERWRERAGGAVVAGPVVADGRVLFMTDQDTLRVVDAATGKWRWDYARDQPEGFVLYGAAPPVVDRGRVLAGYADGSLVSVALADGALQWRQSLGGDATEFTDVDTRPLVDGGRVYAASYRGGVHCLAADGGDVLWRAPGVEGATDLALHDGAVLVTTASGLLIALDGATGRVRYRARLAAEGAVGGFVRVGPWWAVSSPSLGLLVVDGADGRVVQRFDAGSGVSSPPAVLGGMVVVLSNGGWLYGLTRG